jgi:peptide/nickel transport system ATP-binding protein
MTAVLEVEGLTVGFQNRREVVVVVKDVSFSLRDGRILGLAGESGCGKSTSVLTAIGYPMPNSVRIAGSAKFKGTDLMRAPIPVLRSMWGREISYVAQDATQALSPLMKIDAQLAEPLRLHLGMRGTALRRRSVELLESVGIPDPDRALRRYPHQFSGGQQQRIALAIAMACKPRILVLDEPTTGLDVTTQAQIVALITRLVSESGIAAVSISHDLALLATICDEISIMYAGEIVESGPAAQVYAGPRHPYSAALIDAVPRVDEALLVVGIPGMPPRRVAEGRCAFADRCRFAQTRCVEGHPDLIQVSPARTVRCVRTSELGFIPSQRLPSAAMRSERSDDDVLLRVEGLRCSYRGRPRLVAVDGISLQVKQGQTTALVGESGSGKSTVLRAIAGLHTPDAGVLEFAGQHLASRAVRRTRSVRRRLQIVFQDPHASLNPRHRVGDIILRPLALFRPDLSWASRRARMFELLADVRLDRDLADRYPYQLSGGQKQRVALARAFAADPELILCDEVVSALDVSVQASVLELLVKLSSERRTSLLFVTHDLAVVHSIASYVYVMRNGEIVEAGTTDEIFNSPQNEYTRSLLAAVPRPHKAGTEGGRLRNSPDSNEAGIRLA